MNQNQPIRSSRFAAITTIPALWIATILILFLASCGSMNSKPAYKAQNHASPQAESYSTGSESASVNSSGGYTGATRSSDSSRVSASSIESTSVRRPSYNSDYQPPSTPDSAVATDTRDERPNERPGLGTEFGEQRQSAVSMRRFERAAKRPFAQVALHYNNLAGIQQQSQTRGISLHELRAQSANGGISISLVDESGRLLDGGTGGGRTYVVGRDGQRYTLHIRNDTGGRYEVVSSVDGLDVIDGKSASMGKRGYIVAPYSTLVIDGFRTSTNTVAAFRFGSVANSYAGKTSGDRNVGVIGFAFFAERGSRWTSDEIQRRETANPFPGGFSRAPGMVR